MSNPLHKPEEERLLALFRRVWVGREEIADAKVLDGPDVQGTLVDGRRFGMEIVTLTEEKRKASDDALRDWFAPELEAACAAAGISASFVVGVYDGLATRFVEKAHRAHMVPLLVELARQAGGRPLDLDEEALEAQGIDDLSYLYIEPSPEGFDFYFTRSGWLPGSDFVRERIALKDKRAGKYRAALGDDAPALWLLLVAARTLAASVDLPSPEEVFETHFDRVFFMECWQDAEKVVELATRRLQPGPDA